RLEVARAVDVRGPEPGAPPDEDRRLGAAADVGQVQVLPRIALVAVEPAAPAADPAHGVAQCSRGVSVAGEELDGRTLQLDERPPRPPGVLLADHEVGGEPGSESQSGNHPASVSTGEIANEDQRVLLQEPLERLPAD